MSHERWHAIEKIQVQVAAAAALAFMYFVGWRLIHPTDVDGVVVFLPTFRIGSLALFALVVWAMAAATAVITVSARLEGAVLALLVGVAGASMRTEPMRRLVNRLEPNVAGLMISLAVEIVVLLVILAGAMAVIAVVREILGRLLPEWMVPMRRPSAPVESADGAGRPWGRTLLTLLLGFGFVRTDMKTHLMSLPAARNSKDKPSALELTQTILIAFALTLLAGLLGMMLTLLAPDSVERGQILFALAISFFLAAWVVSYFVPAGFSAPYWSAPLVLAIVIYLKNCWVAPDPPLTWARIGAMANILPVDWLTAGCGGAVGGYWLSCRLNEAKDAEAAGKAR